jgi:hypothetical protein
MRVRFYRGQRGVRAQPRARSSEPAHGPLRSIARPSSTVPRAHPMRDSLAHGWERGARQAKIASLTKNFAIEPPPAKQFTARAKDIGAPLCDAANSRRRMVLRVRGAMAPTKLERRDSVHEVPAQAQRGAKPTLPKASASELRPRRYFVHAGSLAPLPYADEVRWSSRRPVVDEGVSLTIELVIGRDGDDAGSFRGRGFWRAVVRWRTCVGGWALRDLGATASMLRERRG